MKIKTRDYIIEQRKSQEELFDAKLEGLRNLFSAELRSVREAVTKVEKVNDQKFQGQNEWRAQMKDQIGTFLARKEFWAVITTILAAVAIYYLTKPK